VPRSPRSRRVDLVTGLSYHLLEWGDADSSDLTVVLIHGFLDLSWGWSATCDAGLGDRFHVVAPDMRGHGDSDRVGAGGYYHFADYIADVDALCDHLPDRPLALVGHSMGGSIASYFAGVFPERVSHLALLEGIGPPELPVSQPDRIRSWIKGWRKARSRSPKIYPSVEAAAERLRKHDARLDPDLAQTLAERGTREVSPVREGQQGPAGLDNHDGGRVFKHDPLHLTMGPYPFQVALAETLWARVACPVLAVDAADSEMLLPEAERERRYAAFANLRREVVADARHMLQRHQPAALSALLCDFLG
jgi:pimeloyl-ACP methyl ester carboxylesterase